VNRPGGWQVRLAWRTTFLGAFRGPGRRYVQGPAKRGGSLCSSDPPMCKCIDVHVAPLVLEQRLAPCLWFSAVLGSLRVDVAQQHMPASHPLVQFDRDLMLISPREYHRTCTVSLSRTLVRSVAIRSYQFFGSTASTFDEVEY
jgi:hypothetical protein